MIFSSFVTLDPLHDVHACEVEAVYLPGDPSVGVADDWDLFVSVDGVDVTYDISKKDRERLIDKAIQHELDLMDDAAIDRFLDYRRG